jgi:Flp pilus assembly pilin Flp
MKRVTSFWTDDAGSTAIEYGLIASLMTVAILPVLLGLQTEIVRVYETIQNELLKRL